MANGEWILYHSPLASPHPPDFTLTSTLAKFKTLNSRVMSRRDSAPREGEEAMPELVLIVLCVVGAFVLGMRQAPLRTWVLGFAAAMLIWQSGALHGEPHALDPGWLGTAGWVL